MGYGVVILIHIINKEKAHYNNIKRASTLCAGPLENKSLKHTHDTILSSLHLLFDCSADVYVSWFQKFKLKYFHSDLKPAH